MTKATVKKRKRKKYTSQQRTDLVTGYLASGQSLRSYAKKTNVPDETLRCWVIGKYKVSPRGTYATITKKKNAKK
jgi:transposase-like protein